jgi:hypothetical protein
MSPTRTLANARKFPALARVFIATTSMVLRCSWCCGVFIAFRRLSQLAGWRYYESLQRSPLWGLFAFAFFASFPLLLPVFAALSFQIREHVINIESIRPAAFRMRKMRIIF